MATGGPPLDGTGGEKWIPGEGAKEPQMDAREDERRKDHTKSTSGKTIKRIDVDSQCHLTFLAKLNFKDYFLEKQPTFDEKFRYVKEDLKCYLETLCTNEMKIEISKNMNEFISSIKSISLDSNVQALLLDSKLASELIEKKVNERKINCFLSKQRDYIYTRPEYEKMVKGVIDELFVWMKVYPKERKYFHFTTVNFQKFRKEHENKNFKFERKVGVISFAAVKSAVADELLKAMELYESDQYQFLYTQTQEEAIQKWSRDSTEEIWQFLNQLHSEGRYIYSRKAFLLKEKPTEKYIKQKLTTSKIRALFEAESDDCVNLIALNKDEADRAEKLLEDCICEVSICYEKEILNIIDSEEFKKRFGPWKGKYLLDGVEEAKDDPEGFIIATDDVIDEIQDHLGVNFCTKRSKTGKKRYATVATRPIILPDLSKELEGQAEFKKMNTKHRCKIYKKFLEPHLANCWLTGKKDFYINFRVHLIAEHAESLNVDALVCPCTTFMFPVNDSFGMQIDLKSNWSADRRPMYHTEKVMSPDGFRCKQIIYLVTCEPNNTEPVNLAYALERVLRKADTSSCKSLAIPLSLLPETVLQRINQANIIATTIKDLPYLNSLEEIFVCESIYPPCNQIEMIWTQFFHGKKQYIDFKPLQESAVRMTSPVKESTNASTINVKIVIGTLHSQQVDVIVNTCGQDLKLENGAVSKSILLKGGQSIQEELTQNFKSIKFGEVAVTKSGDLKCRHIFHSALLYWTPVGNFSLKVLKLVIWNCLKKADELKCSSIAFPSLGTGKLLHPFHLVAETMYHTIQCYERCHGDTKIKDISIVLYEKDTECINQFMAVGKMRDNFFPSREECHPHQYRTCDKMLASKSVTVDLLPCKSTWRWGCLLRVSFDSGSNGKGMEWDSDDSCWNLRIPLPNLLSSISSWFTFELEPHDIIKKRISSVELTLLQHKEGYKWQIDKFFKFMDGITDHFVNYIFIVFQSIGELENEYSNLDGHWKPGKKPNDFPITYTLTGDPQDVSQAKAEIDDMIRKMERDFQRSKKVKDAANVINDDSHLSDFSIFETVTGVVCLETAEESMKMLKTLEATGCSAELDDKSSSIHLVGNLPQIVEANKKVLEIRQKDQNIMDSVDAAQYIISIPMSKRDYQAVEFYGLKNDWFKKISNKVGYINDSLLSNLPAVRGKLMEEKIEELLNKVRMMTSENVLVEKDIDIAKAIEEVQQKKQNVCFITKQNEIEIISDSYTELLEAKGLLQQKMTGKVSSRKTRTFANTEVTHKNLQSTEEANQDLKPIESSVMNQSLRCPMLELKTKKGLKIKIYSGSITRLNVECIVNAANDQLMHGGGVAAAISEAAGYQFDQESKDFVQKHGPIPVGRCCVTSAGKLPYKCVIHTVGPKWGDYRDKSQCLQLLQDSVRVTFEEADNQKMRSIAIPAISSGIFSVPRDKCVEQYFEATMSFSRSYPFKYLQEIHFVDRDESMVRAIQETFQSRTKSASTTGKTDKQNDTFTFDTDNTVHSAMQLSISFTTVNVSENLQIKIHIGNITDIAADAVVCPQDEYCLSENDIARDIFGKIPDKQHSFNVMKYGDVCSQELQENSKWKMIIHAVTPVYDVEHAKNLSEFGKTLNTITHRIIKTADEAKFHSIAIPLLGTGTEEYKTPVETCASNFFKAVMANKSGLKFLNDIYLVLKEEGQEKMYLENFACISCKITQRSVTKNGNSDDFGKTMKEMPKEGENCCICMDTPTKPKQLHRCGHIFCKECIEQYFQYKPACPSCGTIYGKVTGDQPPGTMSIRTNSTRLQGFNDSSGTIVLTYFFNDGKQGAEHPDPGKVYKGFNRSGYLPHNKKGRLVAKLLNVAFSRRLVFTIGRSRTTGHDGVITWNDIHHKTRIEGGPARFGYPDPTYLDRVLEELEAKGVTEESADDPEEYKEYSRQIGY